MLDYKVIKNSYERMPEFTKLLTAERLKVKITYTDKLVISIKENDAEQFRELVDKEKIEVQLEQ